METVNYALREMTQSFKTWITVRRKLYYNIWYFYLFQDPEKNSNRGYSWYGIFNCTSKPVSKGAEHYTVLLTLLIISIVLQAVVAILLGILGTWQKTTQQAAHWLHNAVIIIVFIILMINIIITAFHSWLCHMCLDFSYLSFSQVILKINFNIRKYQVIVTLFYLQNNHLLFIDTTKRSMFSKYQSPKYG